MTAPGPRFISGTGAEVLQAGTLGLQLPFLGVVMFISLLIAVHAIESMVGRRRSGRRACIRASHWPDARG